MSKKEHVLSKLGVVPYLLVAIAVSVLVMLHLPDASLETDMTDPDHPSMGFLFLLGLQPGALLGAWIIGTAYKDPHPKFARRLGMGLIVVGVLIGAVLAYHFGSK